MPLFIRCSFGGYFDLAPGPFLCGEHRAAVRKELGALDGAGRARAAAVGYGRGGPGAIPRFRNRSSIIKWRESGFQCRSNDSARGRSLKVG